MADQVCTLTQVNRRLDFTDGAVPSRDAIITEIIEQVTDEMQQFVGRKLVPEAGATKLLDTFAGHTIAVPYGIRAVTTLSIALTNQPDDGTGTYSAVAAADILLRPLPVDRRLGWPATEIVLKSGPLDTVIPLRNARNGAKLVGDWGFSPTPPVVARIGIDATIAAWLDRRQAGKAGPDSIDLPGLLDPESLAALGRFRGGYGIGIG